MKKSNLYNLSIADKYDFLNKKIYENIKHSHTGRLYIDTIYKKKTAELLGGNYDDLSKIQKDIFLSDIVFEKIYVEDGFLKYTLF